MNDDDTVQPPKPPQSREDARIDDHDDPRLNEPGSESQPGTFIDSEHNMPGQQGAPPPPPDDDQGS